MAEKQALMSDEDLMVRVNQATREGVGWYDSRLSKERQRVINYYNSTLPKRQSPGSSSYISTDVFDSVESMKAQLVETFSANPDNLVSFPALNSKDVESSRVATEYTNYVVFRENDGFGMLHDIAHNGLTARTGIAMAYWDKQKKRTEHSFAGIPYQDVQALASQSDVADLNADADEGSADPQNPTFSGNLFREEDTSKVTIDVLAPEEFLIAPRERTIAKAGYCGHRTRKTKAELVEMGYDKKKVAALRDDEGKTLEMSPEVLARESTVESYVAADSPLQNEVSKVMLYESYVRLDIHDGGGVKLWKVCHVDDQMLSKEEVDRAPYIVFVPLPIPHMFFGNNFAQRVVPTQNARTVLTRGILDHTATTTNPRWTVLKGGLINPREMLDNRQGGVVNVTRADAVKALEQANLNPFVFQTLSMLKENKEESTGISALSQGLNKDAISTQNSAALVDNLVQLSTQRQKIIARNMAKFLSALYLEVYRLVLENQDKEKEKIIEVTGNFVPVKTKDWVERLTCKIALHLGYGERDKETAKFANTYKMLSSDPQLQPMFTPQNRYNLVVDGLRCSGLEKYASYISPPPTTPPPPDPIKMAETKAKTDTAQAALTTAQTGAQKVTNEAQLTQLKEQLAEMSLHVKSLLAERAEQRKDAETANRINISQREMAIAEAAPVGTESVNVAPK